MDDASEFTSRSIYVPRYEPLRLSDVLDQDNSLSLIAEYSSNFWFYFTHLALVLVIFHQYTYRYINLINLNLYIFIVSTFIFYVDPGYVATPIIMSTNLHESMIMSSLYKHVTYFIFHVIPFIFVLYTYKEYYFTQCPFDSSYIASLLLIFTYAFLIDVVYVYHVDRMYSLFIGLLSLVAYPIIVLLSHMI